MKDSIEKPFYTPPRHLLRQRRKPFGRSDQRAAPPAGRSMATPPLGRLTYQTLVVDVEAWLLRSPLSTFPYFMLIAVEAGSFLRGLLLLLAYPLILCLPSHGSRLKAMVMVSFCGLCEEEVRRVCRVVLPKFFLEGVAMEGLEVVTKAARKKKVVAVSSEFPTVMVEGFLKEYLAVDVEAVLGWEVRAVWGRYVGVVVEEDTKKTESPSPCLFGKVMKAAEGHAPAVVGLVGERSTKDFNFPHFYKETYNVTQAQKAPWQPLPREKYPKPLVFHDGRLAFAPTPSATVAMYAFFPLGMVLAVLRCAAFVLLPYSISLPLCSFTGMRCLLVHSPTSPPPDVATAGSVIRGRLFVCNHRTLVDPIAVSGGLNRPVAAVTYGVSRFTEQISPIPTARLTRERGEDRRRMAALLARGDLVVCPEGTTCREPYLLRFSPLFAELASEVTPVALSTHVDMFYGTSTKPATKWLDTFYFLMNMCPEYRVEFLEPVVTVPADGDGGESSHGHSIDVANRVQRVIGHALGYELTGLTRKDKYKMLAGIGNDQGEAKTTKCS